MTGAVCVYLLLGLVFTFALRRRRRDRATGLLRAGNDGTRSIRLYFSYVTLATLGYGDYTPAGDLGRMLAVAEAFSASSTS